SSVVLPVVYGIGTGLPVVIFAVLIALGARGVATAFQAMTGFEKFARVATGVVFIGAGGYLVITHILGIGLPF
ncbi:MAG: sulfite exporter TauE/SafE family protein, partial [Candidatus Binatia bacterium]